jgi:hypothetical protein
MPGKPPNDFAPRRLPARIAVLFERTPDPGRSSSHIAEGTALDYQWEHRNLESKARNAYRLAEYQKRRDAYARLGLA